MKEKKYIKIRWYLFLLFIPIAIIPVAIITFLSTSNIVSYLKEQNKSYYSTILNQVAINIDSVYAHYALTLSNITENRTFIERVNHEYKNYDDENENSLYEDILKPTSIANLPGVVMFYELDKKSIKKQTDYKIHYSAGGKDIIPNLEMLMSDPMFDELYQNRDKKIIIGKLKEGTLSSSLGEQMTTIIYPYYKNNKMSEKIMKFFIVFLYQDFFPQFYEKITNIKYGSLYIIDKNRNIISRNHPSIDDYYEYDYDKKKYVLKDSNPDDPDEKMSFKEYQLLNTDTGILELESVKDSLNRLETDDYYETDELFISSIKYNNKEYSIFFDKSSISNIKLIYIFPLTQIYKPIYKIVNSLYIYMIIIIFLILVLSFISSKFFTEPIKKISLASAEIINHNYDIQINTKNFFGELKNLGIFFNKMTNQIKVYNDKLEDLVLDRTRELKKSNTELSRINDELQILIDEKNQELFMAQKIQQALIPKIFPKSELINISGLYLPMDSLGGDLYDVHKISDTKYAIFILDVCGHGVPAALITTMAKVSFNSLEKEQLSPEEILYAVNNEINNLVGNVGNYITIFYSVIDLAGKKIDYCNAGHNDMLLIKENKDIILLKTNSPFVGLMSDINFRSESISFDNKDKLVLYTDGIPEIENESHEMFGYERLINLLKENNHIEINHLIDIIINNLNDFKGKELACDDMALLIAEFNNS